MIIGKNNSGKSNIIEIINHVFKELLTSDRAKIQFPEIKINFTNTYEELEKIQSSVNLSYYNLNRRDFDNHNARFTFRSEENNSRSIIWKTHYDMKGNTHLIPYENSVADSKHEMISTCSCLYIQADRMIKPEPKKQLIPGSSLLSDIHPDGSGFTNLFRHILQSKKDASEYKKIIIDGMNTILSPEIHIHDIQIISINDDDNFEIYIEESEKPSYPLSSLGSGIKTTLQLIMTTEVIPKLKKIEKHSIIFTFEELENNLHPAAQRRLYKYINEYAKNNNSLFFISTHSSIPLNYFFGSEIASTYHVIQNNGMSEITLISGNLESRETLDDIGANPSDLLQSNGVIWVEGPSDRIYIKKWLELAGFTYYLEGYHYQFMYYGGSLLKHYSVNEVESLINILKINRHSALVMDSDKRRQNEPINDTKKRIQMEFKNNNLYTWLTKGKEIENYLFSDDIKKAFPNLKNHSIGKYQPFNDFLKNDPNKIEFAKKTTQCMTRESLEIYDLKEQINKLGREIKRWNENET